MKKLFFLVFFCTLTSAEVKWSDANECVLPDNSIFINNIINKISDLKSELTKDLAPIKDKPYVVFHDAYQYFEKAFGLNAVGSVALEGDIASSPKQISFIKDKINFFFLTNFLYF